MPNGPALPMETAATDHAATWWRRSALAPTALIAVLILIWELASRGLEPFILPSPSEVLAAGWRTRALLARATLTTVSEAGIGLVVSVALGVGSAAAMDFWPALRRAVYPLLVASQTIQVLAVAPLLVIWFGLGWRSTVTIVVLMCFFPMTVSTADGLTSTSPDFLALLHVAGARRAQVWRMARLPSALPSFFSGLRIAVAYAIVAATIGEWVGGSEGLGTYMLRSKNSVATDQVFVAMLVTTFLSVSLFALVAAAERAALPWYHSAERSPSWSGDLGA